MRSVAYTSSARWADTTGDCQVRDEKGLIERARKNDPEALIAATIAPRGTDGLEELLPRLDLPCLLYCGEADGFFPGSKEAA